MVYLVDVSGRMRLPVQLEPQVLTVLESRMSLDVDTLAELAATAGAELTRIDDEWVAITTDPTPDVPWSEQGEVFFTGLQHWVHEGRVDIVDADRRRWSYVYSPTGVSRQGDSGVEVPGAPTYGAPPAAGPAAEPPPNTQRVLLMTLLLVVGVLLIIGIALIGSGF